MAEQATTAAVTEPTNPVAEPQATHAQPESLLNADGKAETPKAEEGKDNGQTDQKDAPPAVPEKYDFKVPEGFNLDPAALDAFTPLAQKFKLGQEDAQELVNLHAQQIGAFQKAQQEAWSKQQQDWVTEFKADKEFGGTNSEASIQAANAAYNKFATKEDIEAIKTLGIGNFPPLVRMFARVNKLMGEDKFHQGGSSHDAAPSLASAMFPDFKK